MGITCPACNKPNQTGAVCARCGCDLSPLQTIVAAAAAGLSEAREALHAGDWPIAHQRARQSWGLCHSVEAARVAFLAAAALGQTAEAVNWQERAQGG